MERLPLRRQKEKSQSPVMKREYFIDVPDTEFVTPAAAPTSNGRADCLYNERRVELVCFFAQHHR